MAGNIKGITIEIGADTSKLSDALKDVNKQSRDLQSELKQVDRLLKLDPGNTELLAQKQKILSEAVENTSSKLKTLKEAERQVDQQFKEGKVNEEQYRALKREIIQTTENLKSLEKQAKQSNVALEKVGAVSGKIGEKAGAAGRALTPASVAITGLAAVAINSASDLNESMNKVEVAFKESANSVKQFSDTTLDSFGIAKGTALDMAALFGDMGTAMGQTPAEAAKMSTSLVGLAGDLASFKNIGIDQAEEALKGIFTGEGESLKSLGVIMLDSTLQEYAQAQGIKKKYSEMTQAEKVQLRYNYVMDKTKNAQGDFARTSDGTANSMRIMQESLKELSAEFGEVLLPIITPIIQKLTELIKWFGGLDEGIKKIIVGVLGFIAIAGPLLLLIGGIASGIGALIPVIGLLAGPFAGIILIIAAVIAIGAALIASWGNIKANAASLLTSVSTTFSNIKAAISDKINAAKDAVYSAIEKIKSFFSFKWSWPKIPLPHFSVVPQGWKIGDLLKGSIPKLGISWYDKGGIFDSASIIGVGEKRPEFVGALDDLRYLIRDELKNDQNKTTNNNIQIYNPMPEKSSDSVARQLTRLGYMGVI
jgi:phage-related minor tail protein